MKRCLRMLERAPLVDSVWILVEMAAGVSLPSRLMIVATRPAMCGVAMDVPEMLLVACGFRRDIRCEIRKNRVGRVTLLTLVLPIQEEITFWPGAKMSTTEP